MARLVYIIEQANQTGLPVYYDPAAGRSSGHGINGWIQEKDGALGFATAADAQKFIEAVLPHQGLTLRPVPHTRRE